MKKYLSLFAAMALLLCCEPKDTPEGNDPSQRIVTADASEITETSAVLKGYANLSDGTGSVKFGVAVSADKNPTPDNGKSFETWDLDENNQFTIQATGLLMAEDYYYRAYIKEGGRYQYGKPKQFTTKDFVVSGQETVDLGLSVKWRSCNLGASTPFDAGAYYAWGETKAKEDYSGKTYAWVRGDDFTQYNLEDQKIQLDLSDDAARVALGGSWRMPTYDEFRELLSCPRTRTGRKGVMGFLFTGPSGNRLFLPAAGDWVGTNFNDEEGRGCYWTSSLRSPNSYYAWLALMQSGTVTMGGLSRYHGHSIRPVTE